MDELVDRNGMGDRTASTNTKEAATLAVKKMNEWLHANHGVVNDLGVPGYRLHV